jgi:hypothetical protein
MGHSYYDVNKLFLSGIMARDIAEPLPSFDGSTPAAEAAAAMARQGYAVAGVRRDGIVCGYVAAEDLSEDVDASACELYAREFEDAAVLTDRAGLTDVILALADAPCVFVRVLGQVGGIITRDDLQDPPVRMWLFGLLTTMEMRFHALIQQRFPDDGWQEYLSPARVERAQELLDERARREQHVTLLDCLQLADKGQIIARDEQLRTQVGFVSRNRADEVIKIMQRLRNNLAHSQDIIASDWKTILAVAANLDRLIKLVYPE